MTESSLTRQLLVAGSPPLAALSVGGAFTYPSILIQQLNGNDSSIVLDLDTLSWVGSIHGISGIPSIFWPAIMQWQGRKFAFIIACLISICGWVFSIAATNAVTILIGESFQGLGNSSLMAVSLTSISEMVAPRIRNVSMCLYFLGQGFGMTLCSVFGRYLHWKTVSLILVLPMTVAMLMGFMWPESPPWLAHKGKFERCEKAFVWLRGAGDQSKKELHELISAQKECLTIAKNNQGFNNMLKTLLTRDFYLPCSHMFVLICLFYLSGVTVVSIYGVKIIQTATTNENAAYYGTIFVNTTLFISVGIGALFLRRFKNKSIVLPCSITSVICLVFASLSVYLQTIDILSGDSLIGLYFLIVYLISAGSGIVSVVLAMATELMPVKYRGQGGALYVIFTSLLHSLTLKLAPYLFVFINVWGTLMLFAACTTICGLLVWKYVPETKGKTLQQLEDYYTFGHFNKTRVCDDLNEELDPL